MTTVAMLLQPCLLILAIFLCHAEAHPVDCEKYPYHSSCRGMQTKRRYIMEQPDCDVNTDPDCPNFRMLFGKPSKSSSQETQAKQRIWMELLAEFLQRENERGYGSERMRYGMPHEKTRNEGPHMEHEERRIPKDYWQEAESLETDY